jgi:hypothetical protein
MRIVAAIVALCAAAFLFIVGRHWWTRDPRQASQKAIGVAILVLMASSMAALAGPARANAEWGGPDLGISCDTVRAYRAEIEAMSPKVKAQLSESFGITRKQRRQAMACLRKVN